ncbi:GNAT family N-acetyltransferase [Agrobacterium sp. B1(2019)]|uniref:GNAT family N-acetyltransferase n=1 Tax=Agrobacterium sp. B1(2019) TaxID=2607032 RepID=UPI0011EE5929|nr:GNAT family N-acetyltransferase [Agrobacterium sp. B1(2019)]TZG37426.1 GNAT family N-acetyltransferase [Agrobacterium sp. B1(2019)]
MTMIVRRARAGDVDIIFDIRTSVRQNHISRERLKELGITEQSVGEALELEVCGWVAECDGAAVAFSMIDSETGSVFALFVRPAFEGRGLGGLLLREAEQALFRSHETIWLETDAEETVRANGFYRKAGWQPVALTAKGEMRYEKTARSSKT